MLVSVPPPIQQFNSPPVDRSAQTQVPQPKMVDPKPRPAFNLLAVGLTVATAIIGLIWASSWFLNKNRETTLSNTASASVPLTTPNPTKSKSPSPQNSPDGMALVRGGEFMMGRDDGKLEDEKPAHKVSVNGFFMDVYEVTNKKYAEFIKLTGHQPQVEWRNGVYPNNQANFPAVNVNWTDANAFCKNAGKRLPTEDEWEFAARGTSNFLYPWGNIWKQGQANVETQTFAEVGRFKGTSPYGIYDLVGNAGEWTASDFKAYPNGKLDDVYAGKTNLKTVRGGNIGTPRDFATATYRIGWQASEAETYDATGFRCVQDADK